MNVLDLFSGIGGFSLGLERAGMRTVAFCEIDPYCRRVLAKHWPDVPVFGDVRELTASSLVADADYQRQLQQGGSVGQERRRASYCGVDVIAGGFPCQDLSYAGKGAGLGGERSGLWSEYARIIGEVRPRYVIVENVAALLGRGLARVLGDLAALGFDAEWHCIPASAVGAPHRRDRIWIVAYACDPERRSQCGACDDHRSNGDAQRQEGSDRSEPSREDVAYADQPRLSLRDMLAKLLCRARNGYAREESAVDGWWRTEPDVGRVAHGVSNRVDRLAALGNAVVPQIPEIIGRAIMNAEHDRTYRPAHHVGCAVPLRTWAPSPDGELS
jgi:DNA (cytosine-5)-methyltransferase 1